MRHEVLATLLLPIGHLFLTVEISSRVKNLTLNQILELQELVEVALDGGGWLMFIGQPHHRLLLILARIHDADLPLLTESTHLALLTAFLS